MRVYHVDAARAVHALALALYTVCGAAAAQVPDPKGVAVIIGNRNCVNDRGPEVAFACRDVEAFKRYVPDVAGFDPQKDERGCLLPVNADPNTVEISGYPIDVLYGNLAKPAEARSVRVSPDACFSGDRDGIEAKGYEGTGYPTGERSEVLIGTDREAEGKAEHRAQEQAEQERMMPGKRFRDCPECPELVVVPSGSFMMGSPSSESERDKNEGPVHRVRIGRPFAVGVYEVTFGEWDACVSGGGCGGYRPDDKGWGRGNRPVIEVSWHDAKTYVGWLWRKTGEEYRLLSEAEWEYVARAGTGTRYWWGDEIGRNRSNCRGCGSRWDGKQTAPVGSFSANGFGLYDVHGNVREWVEDCWNTSYRGAPGDGSAWESGDCRRRVRRGGFWNYLSGDPRSANRSRKISRFRGVGLGFRVARMLRP